IAQLFQVSETDLEVIEATGRSPAEDSGLGLASTMPDIRNRPPAPLPYRPMSAGPILHQHARHLNASLADIPHNPLTVTPNRLNFAGGPSAAHGVGGVGGVGGLHHLNRHKISSSSSDVVKQLKNKVIVLLHYFPTFLPFDSFRSSQKGTDFAKLGFHFPSQLFSSFFNLLNLFFPVFLEFVYLFSTVQSFPLLACSFF
uniref:Uncharacterized protein n=1 Tax=Anopheles atroparvus TaxID=41427 RepID=A0A182JJS3_ANOAO